ncbi:MAG: sigma 54-interacting transcriptional regulator [Sulfuricellaceae bacterium]|nr:sigma 54-interacting transcriptional regulator [Sulfuricellaceae bacterium]
MSQVPVQIQSLIDTQENPFVLIDKDYRIVAANHAYCMRYGTTEEQVVGRACHEISHHSSAPCHLNGETCPHQQVFEEARAQQVMHTHYDHHNRPEHVRIQGHPVQGLNGELYLGEAIYPFAPSTAMDCDEMRMIGKSSAFLNCVDNLTRVAESEASILLYGPSGVGKELAAQYVHRRSSRTGKAFVAVDCASIAESVFESEMFGHEKGAFTGCVGRKLGLFELADGGTLFLDEIGEVPLSMQAKLLRVLESGEYRRVGGTETLRCDARIVSATNRDLLEMVDKGQFRLDLYYRIAGIDITLPTLKERRQDIPAMSNALLHRLSGDGRFDLGKDAIVKLMDYDFPGNIRELRNILQKALVLSNDGMIHAEHIRFDNATSLPPVQKAGRKSAKSETSDTSIAELEVAHITRLLEIHGGHRRKVAEILGISERTLYRKLILYGLR